MESDQEKKERKREIAKALLDIAKLIFGVVVLGYLLKMTEEGLTIWGIITLSGGVIATVFFFLLANFLMKHHRQ